MYSKAVVEPMSASASVIVPAAGSDTGSTSAVAWPNLIYKHVLILCGLALIAGMCFPVDSKIRISICQLTWSHILSVFENFLKGIQVLCRLGD